MTAVTVKIGRRPGDTQEAGEGPLEFLDTDAGRVFVKGLRVDHPGVVRQGREAMINPYVHAVAPRLRWHDQAAGWDLLTFEYIDDARHADYRPGSPDLPRVISAMHDLAAVGCPDLPVNRPGSGGLHTSTAKPTWNCSTVMRCCTPTSTR